MSAVKRGSIIAFPRLHWFRERVVILRYTYIVCSKNNVPVVKPLISRGRGACAGSVGSDVLGCDCSSGDCVTFYSAKCVRLQ
jgi:hypothetical protein